MRIVMFVVITPVLLFTMALFFPLLWLGLMAGALWIMIEFLITGESITDKDFSPKEENKENENK